MKRIEQGVQPARSAERAVNSANSNPPAGVASGSRGSPVGSGQAAPAASLANPRPDTPIPQGRSGEQQARGGLNIGGLQSAASAAGPNGRGLRQLPENQPSAVNNRRRHWEEMAGPSQAPGQGTPTSRLRLPENVAGSPQQALPRPVRRRLPFGVANSNANAAGAGPSAPPTLVLRGHAGAAAGAGQAGQAGQAGELAGRAAAGSPPRPAQAPGRDPFASPGQDERIVPPRVPPPIVRRPPQPRPVGLGQFVPAIPFGGMPVARPLFAPAVNMDWLLAQPMNFHLNANHFPPLLPPIGPAQPAQAPQHAPAPSAASSQIGFDKQQTEG